MSEEEKVMKQDKRKMEILSELAFEEKKEEQIEHDKEVMQEKAAEAIEELKKEEQIEHDKEIMQEKANEAIKELNEEEQSKEIIDNKQKNILNNKNNKKNRINKKNVVLLVVLCLLVISLFATIIINVNKKKNDNTSSFDKEKIQKNGIESLTDNQKKFIGVSQEKEEKKEEPKEELTDEYKKYLKLTEEEKKELDVVPRKEEVPIEVLDEVKEEIDIDEKLPSKFNLKDKINVKVEDQGTFGLCWDFASMKSLETYLSLNENKNYDLSEIHVDYLRSKLFYGYRDIHEGGNFEEFVEYLKITGPILESTLEYGDYEDYKDFNKFKEVLPVTKVIKYPSIYSFEEDAFEKKTEFRKIIKNHIMKNGSLYAVIDATSLNYDSKDVTQYCSEDCMSNHAISIVGWDDNYSKENFTDKKGNHPKEDGAYIALNSWGKRFGNDGYFYISYEDRDVENEMSGILSTSLNSSLKIDDIKSSKIKEYILKRYNNLITTVNGKKYLTDIVLDDINYLDLSGLGLTEYDLTDLEKFSNLTMIDLSKNNIKNLKIVSKILKNQEIFDIDLSDNNISDLSGISDLSKISSLDLSHNNIENLDELLKMENLYSLDLSYNNIASIDSLSVLTGLAEISFEHNNIISVDVTKLENLYSLNISDNPIDWNNVKIGENVTYIYLANTNVENIKELTISPQTVILDISNNKIESLEGIDKYELFDLNLSNVDLSKLTDLSKIKSKGVEAKNCNIDDISIFNGAEISNLDLTDNKITDLSNLEIESLYNIDLSNNKITKGFEKLSNINTVILSNNGIINLDEFDNVKEVYDLDLSNNPINNYNSLKNLDDLNSLSLENNSNIDLSVIPKNLEILNIKNANVNDISEIYNLKKLWLINLTGHLDSVSLDKLSENKTEDESINIVVESVSADVYNEVQQKRNVSLDVENIIYNYNEEDIVLNYGDSLNQILLSSFFNLELTDISVDKNCLNIKILGDNPTINYYLFKILFNK